MAIGDSGMGSAIMIIELAGNMNSNTFGIYDIYTQNKIELFNGALIQVIKYLLVV
jgi:hypothetical protein